MEREIKGYCRHKMRSKEWGIKLEQCVFCRSEYEPEDSNSNMPEALCSIECELGFNEHQKSIENWLYTSPLKEK